MRRRSIRCWRCRRQVRPSVRLYDKISHRAAAAMDARRTDLDKSQRGMKSVRRRVWRPGIDFADDALDGRARSHVRTDRDKAGAHCRVRAPMTPPRSDRHRQSADSGRGTRGSSGCRIGHPGRTPAGRRRGFQFAAPKMPGRRDEPDRSGTSQDNSCACALLSASMAWPNGCAVGYFRGCHSLQRLIAHGAFSRDVKKICGPSPIRRHARVLRIPVAGPPSRLRLTTARQ